ncbi:MAG: PAS domain S-box protein [bacterium]|nr:PAS domain S-box protein [bacterium]
MNANIQPPLFHEVNEDVILSAIGEGSADAITCVDADGIVLSWTPGAERMLGYSKDEVVGQSIDVMLPKDIRESAHQTIKDQMSGKTGVIHEESVRLHKDGRRIPVLLTRVPLKKRDGRVVSLLAILKDVSEEKKLQKQLERLDAMAKVAAKVAHEIRTPLGVLFLKSDLLVERLELTFEEWGKGDPGVYKQKVEKCVYDIQKQINRLEEIANNYLHLSKSRTLDRQTVHLQKFFKELVKELQEHYPAHVVRFDLELDENAKTMDADPQQMQRVIVNLVRNSIEAMQIAKIKDGVIRLCSHQLKDAVQLEVIDTGPGMPKEIRDNIFDPFITTKSIGTGLGLYLVREIIQNHKGEISIETEEGKGTAIRIVLPNPA